MTMPTEILLALLLLFLLAGVGLAWFTASTARRVETAMPPAGRFIDVPGARLHIVERGSGPPLLLIHGLGGQLHHFAYGMLERLAAHHRVVLVDRPGSGYSVRNEGSGADLQTQAAAMAALIDALQLGRPLVVGHSLGGAVALTLALEHPEKVAGLALIAPVTHAPDDVPPAFKALTIRSQLGRSLAAKLFATPATLLRGQEILAQVFAPEPVPTDFATRAGGLLGLRPAAFLAACADLQALPDGLGVLPGRYPDLRLPLGVLYAYDDNILDWRANGQALVDKVPSATLQLVDGGHMLPVTQPQLCAEFVEGIAQRVQDGMERVG